MIKRIFSDRIELVALSTAFVAAVVLWTSTYEVPLIGNLQGGIISDVLANEYGRAIGSALGGGIVSAYIFYILVEFIPRYRREQVSLNVLNKAVNTIVDALESGRIFQHEESIENSSPIVESARIEDGLTYLRHGQDFLNLKSAGHTAETRYKVFSDLLILAASISPAHAEAWLVITDKVRLLSEVMSERPSGDLDMDVLYDFKNICRGKYADNSTALFYLSIRQRAYEFLLSIQKWKKLTG